MGAAQVRMQGAQRPLQAAVQRTSFSWGEPGSHAVRAAAQARVGGDPLCCLAEGKAGRGEGLGPRLSPQPRSGCRGAMPEPAPRHGGRVSL